MNYGDYAEYETPEVITKQVEKKIKKDKEKINA